GAASIGEGGAVLVVVLSRKRSEAQRGRGGARNGVPGAAAVSGDFPLHGVIAGVARRGGGEGGGRSGAGGDGHRLQVDRGQRVDGQRRRVRVRRSAGVGEDGAVLLAVIAGDRREGQRGRCLAGEVG